MKNKLVTGTILSVVFALLLPLSAIGDDEPGRLPPKVKKYPARGSAEEVSYSSITHYTKDSSSKVVDFYRNSLGMDPVEGGRFLIGTDATYQDKQGHTDSNVWLIIDSTADRKSNSLSDEALFGFLQAGIMGKRIHSEKDLQPVKQKYRHLAKGWYPDFDAQEKLNSCSEETREGVDASIEETETEYGKERQEEMLRLFQQGRHQEAQVMMKDFANQQKKMGGVMQQEQEADHWDEWIACLDEVDKHDFQTKIEMGLYHNRHFRPSTAVERGEDPKKGESSGSNNNQKKTVGRDIGTKVKGLKKMFRF